MKRQKDRIEGHLADGFHAIEENDTETAERHFRAADYTIGLALAHFYGRSWERAVNKAFAALSEGEHGTEDEAVALKVLALASKRLEEKEALGSAKQRQERLIARADERLEEVDWKQVNKQIRGLTRDKPGVYGALASVRMGRRLAEQGLQTATQLLLAGDYHRAACIGDDMRHVSTTNAGMAAFLSLCPECFEEKMELDPDDLASGPMQRLLVTSGRLLYKFQGKGPGHSLILGVSAVHFGEYLARHGQDAKRMWERAGVHFDAAKPPSTLSPEETERWTTCLDFHRGGLLEFKGDEAGALTLIEDVASRPVVPWNDRAGEVADRIHRRQAAEERRKRIAALRDTSEAARKRGDNVAELSALSSLAAETELELQQLERLASLRAGSGDSKWVEDAAAAARRDSHDEFLLGRLSEEGARRWSAGEAREALNLLRVARRMGQLPRDAMSAYAAALASLDRFAEAGKAYETLGGVAPERYLDGARCYAKAGEDERALAAVQALFGSPDTAGLWEEGLRLVEFTAPPGTLRLLAERVLQRDPSNSLARAAKARAEAEEFRAASEDREVRRAEARKAVRKGEWSKARSLLLGIPEKMRDVELWGLLARAHEAGADSEAALKCYEAVPATLVSLAGRARNLSRLRRFDEARQELVLLLERIQPDEEPGLGSDADIKALWAQVRGELREAARLAEDEKLLSSIMEEAGRQGDFLAELEALTHLAARQPAYDKDLMDRVHALEDRLPLKEKARFIRGRMPMLVLCDTNILLSKVVHDMSLPEELHDLGRPQAAERFEMFASGKENATLAVTDTVARELKSLLIYHQAIQDSDEASEAMDAMMQRADALVSELQMDRVARLSPRPPPEFEERVRSFYKSMAPRMRAITQRKVSRRPERKGTILKRRGLSGKKSERSPMPEHVDQRLLAEAASLAEGPLPGFGGIGIMSDDADFRSFAQEIEATFGVRIC